MCVQDDGGEWHTHYTACPLCVFQVMAGNGTVAVEILAELMASEIEGGGNSKTAGDGWRSGSRQKAEAAGAGGLTDAVSGGSSSNSRGDLCDRSSQEAKTAGGSKDAAAAERGRSSSSVPLAAAGGLPGRPDVVYVPVGGGGLISGMQVLCRNCS